MKHLRTFTLAFIVLFIASCNDKDSSEASIENTVLPSVSGVDFSNITSYGATVQGSVTNAGGSRVIGKGVCFSQLHGFPSIYDSIAPAGSDLGSFTATVTGLTRGVRYWVRAYATNDAGTAYGASKNFIPSFSVGQNYQGGILFYLESNGVHGEIAALEDISTSSVWGCNSDSIPGATGIGYGFGYQNSHDIDTSCTATGAARLCKNFNGAGFTDWFLPSYGELQLMRAQKDAIGGFSSGNYWSSTQYDATHSYYLNFSTGFLGPQAKSTPSYVRAVRGF